MIIVKTAFRHLYLEPSSFRGLLDFSLTSLNKIIDNIAKSRVKSIKWLVRNQYNVE
jgi:hypothetical protein